MGEGGHTTFGNSCAVATVTHLPRNGQLAEQEAVCRSSLRRIQTRKKGMFHGTVPREKKRGHPPQIVAKSGGNKSSGRVPPLPIKRERTPKHSQYPCSEPKKKSLGTETVFIRRGMKRGHLLTVLQLSLIPT